jgi:hypothetical protein
MFRGPEHVEHLVLAPLGEARRVLEIDAGDGARPLRSRSDPRLRHD